MTMLMMERLVSPTHKSQELVLPDKDFYIQQKRLSEDSRDMEMCEEDEEDLNVDVENDEGSLCPVDLTRREKFPFCPKSDSHSDFSSYKEDLKRSESVCSDVSRSRSPLRDPSPSVVVSHPQRRLAFSVENILDPNKFTGRQGLFSDGICCWKPLESSRDSADFDESETGGLYFPFNYNLTKFILR